MPEAVVIGIDGGGTKTRVTAIAADPSAGHAALASSDSGPCNIAAMSVPDAISNVGDAIARLGIDGETVLAVCAGVAGFSFESRRRDFLAALAALYPRAIATVIPDFAAAHLGANAGAAGITAIAGTGSVAYGQNAAGRDHRAGGYGYLIDDAGSGYGIGRRAIAAVLNASDGSGEPTELSENLSAELGSAHRTYIIPGVYGGRIDRVRIAALSRVVSQAAAHGDAVSIDICNDAAEAQARAVIAVAAALFDGNTPFPVARFGGVWNAGEVITSPFDAAVSRRYPRAVFGPAALSADIGAALHARTQLQDVAADAPG